MLHCVSGLSGMLHCVSGLSGMLHCVSGRVVASYCLGKMMTSHPSSQCKFSEELCAVVL